MAVNRAPRDRQDRFRSYSRVVRTGPLAWHRPTTEDEVVAAVRAARGGRLKAVGAGHSFSAVAAPEHHALTLDGLSGVLHLDTEQRLVTVWAGTRLRDLSAALLARGWTLPVVGSIQAQSVAGAIATGTHGSSLVHGNLATLVHALRLVDGCGEVVDLGPDDPRLSGARVHLGALGIATCVTLRVEPAFRLQQEVEHVPVDEVDVMGSARSAEYAKAWWLPGASRAQVVRYTRTDQPITRRPSTRTLRWVDDNVMHRGLFHGLVALGHRRPGWAHGINDRLSGSYLGPRVQVAPSSLVLNTPMPLRHRETEAAVPLAHAQEAYDRVVELVRSERLAADFPLEVRFVRGDANWLSPAYGGDTCQIGAYATDGPHRARYFAGFWEAMDGLDARPHWGKELHQRAADLAPMYPAYKDFLALRDELDPERVFDNAFLRQVLSDDAAR
ncbi:MAG TPA: D-arabinono-1,4-lactone oxidase [Mycobacteriales bacterium]|nr:D-arabinono-1,4-lactone oxidase [Mycobacteriales bacterium]